VKNDDIGDLVGLVAFIMICACIAIWLSGCATVQPREAGADCAAACANVDRLGCMTMQAPTCLEVCEAHEQRDPTLVDEACVARAESCDEIRACE